MPMLPKCLSNPYYKQYFENCNKKENLIGGKLKGKKRMEFITQHCCQEVACLDPSSLDSRCVDYKPPQRPHFGALQNEDNNPKYSGVGIL